MPVTYLWKLSNCGLNLIQLIANWYAQMVLDISVDVSVESENNVIKRRKIESDPMLAVAQALSFAPPPPPTQVAMLIV